MLVFDISSVMAYLPIVQNSLPRILNAAAPPGGVARENRKQCLKVCQTFTYAVQGFHFCLGYFNICEAYASAS